jgi:hypothetical protein
MRKLSDFEGLQLLEVRFFFFQKSLDFYTWFSMYSKNIGGWLNVCTSSQIWLNLPMADSYFGYKQCAPSVGALITL